MTKTTETEPLQAAADEQWLVQYWAPAAHEWLTKGAYNSAYDAECAAGLNTVCYLPGQFRRRESVRVVAASAINPSPLDARIKWLIGDDKRKDRAEAEEKSQFEAQAKKMAEAMTPPWRNTMAAATVEPRVPLSMYEADRDRLRADIARLKVWILGLTVAVALVGFIATVAVGMVQ